MMIDFAHEYAARGWKIFPVHTPDADGKCSCRKPDCSNVGKHPRTQNGLKDATVDADQVDQWWTRWPDSNIGLITGEESGLVVLDVDPRHGGNESVKALQDLHGAFVDRVYAKTGGGGWHLLFAHPGVKIGNVQGTPDRPGKLGPGLDIRGDGGYIVAPPSRHASGGQYSWKVAPTVGLPDLPEWLLKILTEKKSQAPIEIAEGHIPEGGRDLALTSMAGSMRRRGMSEASIHAALTEENKRCNPPMGVDDINRIAKSVCRYSPDDPAVQESEVDPDGERPDGVFYVSDFADKIDALYEQGMTPGASTGWPNLDQLYTVKPGQWTVISGVPGHGKSGVLDSILVNLAVYQNWKFAICSPENQPLERHAAGLMAIWANRPFQRGPSMRMDKETLLAAKEWLQEHFVFLLPDEASCTVRGILDRLQWLHNNDTINGAVIDPWNELEHRRPSNMTETEYVSQSLSRLRRFTRKNGSHLWLVAHPTKLSRDRNTQAYPVPTLYDISGSSHFRNKADMGIIVWRDVTDEHSPTQIHVQKVRFRECGKIGMSELRFNSMTGGFTDFLDNYVDYSSNVDF